MPEQPPPFTPSRTPLCCVDWGRFESCALTDSAARGVTLTDGWAISYLASCRCSTAGAGTAMPFFFFQSAMAALMASSASTEQWIFTGGSDSSLAISRLVILTASSTDLPFPHSVTSELEAMAEPQPKVLNLAS